MVLCEHDGDATAPEHGPPVHRGCENGDEELSFGRVVGAAAGGSGGARFVRPHHGGRCHRYDGRPEGRPGAVLLHLLRVDHPTWGAIRLRTVAAVEG